MLHVGIKRQQISFFLAKGDNSQYQLQRKEDNFQYQLLTKGDNFQYQLLRKGDNLNLVSQSSACSNPLFDSCTAHDDSSALWRFKITCPALYWKTI